jgi:hypothetical protein
MAHDVKIANEAASAGADAVCALANGGKLRLYDGTKPATADTDPTENEHVLSEHALDATAFDPAENGVATANAIGDDTDANATGNAAWFRVFKANGTSPLWDGTVGVTGSSSDVEMPTVAIQQHATVQVPTFTYTASKG